MDFIKAWARAIKYGFLKWSAQRRITRATPARAGQRKVQCAYLIGCGRSGTTVCGKVLNLHSKVDYYFEPYHLWATVDPSVDALNLYYLGAVNFILDSDRCTDETRRRFERLFLDRPTRNGAAVMVEKTPFNACRIGFLDAVSPGCKFIHLVRDGVDVARSIDRLSRDRGYAIVGKPGLNRWWGRGGSKWTALSTDGFASDYFADEVSLLRSYESKGAYEWLVSLAEVDRWRDRLGDRLLEMTYDELTTHPRESLEKICRFLDLPVDPGWMARSLKLIDSTRRSYGIPLVLPPKMAEVFNRAQERFGFLNRAIVGRPQTTTMVQIAIVSNEPTPYRLHVLERLSQELNGVFIHNIFTHTISNPSMPWQMRIGAHLNPIFFPKHHLKAGSFASPRHVRLFHDIQDHLFKNDVQMVVLLGYNDLTRLMLIRWGRRLGIPIILAADSNIFGDARTPWLLRMIKRPFVRWVLRRLAGLMPMGTCGRAYFRHYLDHNLPEFLFPYEPNYKFLRNIDPRDVSAFQQKYHLDPDRKRLLYCGRLVGVKRVDVLLEAFSRVALSRPEWDVVIVGDGPLREQLESSLPDEIRPRVKWLGFLQFDETVLAYHACNVLVHPSEFEPWALVINEAVACELPVIATSVVGAAVELVRHRENGLIIAPRSAQAMTDALWEITQPDRLLEMKSNCLPMLDSWRHAADPVDGVREALRHFGLTWRQPDETTKSRELASSLAVMDRNRPIMNPSVSAASTPEAPHD